MGNNILSNKIKNNSKSNTIKAFKIKNSKNNNSSILYFTNFFEKFCKKNHCDIKHSGKINVVNITKNIDKPSIPMINSKLLKIFIV
jgi:hypothetical protein